MNTKYKININKPELSKEDIAKYKNFDRVLSQHKRRTKKRSMHSIGERLNKLLPVIIIVVIILMVVAYFEKFVSKLKKENKPATQQEQLMPEHWHKDPLEE